MLSRTVPLTQTIHGALILGVAASIDRVSCDTTTNAVQQPELLTNSPRLVSCSTSKPPIGGCHALHNGHVS